MVRYSYRKLNEELEEVRILALLPGSFDDRLRVRISHVTFIPPDEGPKQTVSLEQIRKTLPTEWGAYETIEGHIVFENDGTESTSWTHPDPSFGQSRYNTLSYRPHIDFEPQYEALSYTWSPEDFSNVYVEDPMAPSSVGSAESTLSTIPIHRNLDLALRHLRLTEKARSLWIDALCIDQNNTPERSKQVHRMSNIYKLARRVVVWLGQEDEDSGVALEALQTLGAEVVVTREFADFRSPEAVQLDWFRPELEMSYDKRTWDAIHRLVSRRWFGRLWIWQRYNLLIRMRLCSVVQTRFLGLCCGALLFAYATKMCYLA